MGVGGGAAGGTGMARTYTAAGFVKNNMPVGQAGLSDQEAIDVAEYFTHQPRRDFPTKVNDWPNGGKPKQKMRGIEFP